MIAPRPLALALVVAACAGPARVAPHAPARIHAFRIGALEAVALDDGAIHVPNDGKTFVGQPPQAVGDALAANGLPRGSIDFGIEPLLVKDGARVLLFDTGAGDADFAQAGHLPDALRAAGIAPAQVTDIFLSHGDPDHVGGLVTRTGALAFPRATVHLSAPEWAQIQASRELPKLAAAIAPHVHAFAPGAPVVPGVTAVDTRGHTPGHSSYLIESAGERLLYLGDVAHQVVLSVQHPDWVLAWDQDEPAARPMRRATLQRAADEGLRVYAGHVPFPGLGHVRATGAAFVWEPEGCPRPGETAVDCPWAEVGRDPQALRRIAPAIVDELARDARVPALLAAWGSALDYNQAPDGTLGSEPIVPLALSDELARLAGAPPRRDRVVHAGVQHTYGYLFSVLPTPYGFKRARWVDPAIDSGLGLPRGTIAPVPRAGTLLGNVTWLAGSIAFAGEPERAALSTALVSPALQALDIAALHVVRITETAGDVALRTDFVDLPHPTDAAAALLVYSVRVAGASRLITMFPISAASRAKYTSVPTGDAVPITTQYNAWVDGLSGTTVVGRRRLQ